MFPGDQSGEKPKRPKVSDLRMPGSSWQPTPQEGSPPPRHLAPGHPALAVAARSRKRVVAGGGAPSSVNNNPFAAQVSNNPFDIAASSSSAAASSSMESSLLQQEQSDRNQQPRREYSTNPFDLLSKPPPSRQDDGGGAAAAAAASSSAAPVPIPLEVPSTAPLPPPQNIVPQNVQERNDDPASVRAREFEREFELERQRKFQQLEEEVERERQRKFKQLEDEQREMERKRALEKEQEKQETARIKAEKAQRKQQELERRRQLVAERAKKEQELELQQAEQDRLKVQRVSRKQHTTQPLQARPSAVSAASAATESNPFAPQPEDMHVYSRVEADRQAQLEYIEKQQLQRQQQKAQSLKRQRSPPPKPKIEQQQQQQAYTPSAPSASPYHAPAQQDFFQPPPSYERPLVPAQINLSVQDRRRKQIVTKKLREEGLELGHGALVSLAKHVDGIVIASLERLVDLSKHRVGDIPPQAYQGTMQDERVQNWIQTASGKGPLTDEEVVAKAQTRHMHRQYREISLEDVSVLLRVPNCTPPSIPTPISSSMRSKVLQNRFVAG